MYILLAILLIFIILMLWAKDNIHDTYRKDEDEDTHGSN